jgi:hypothetical protein
VLVVTALPSSTSSDYPVYFEVEYPEQRNRLTVALRILWIIPIAIILGALSPGSFSLRDSDGPGFAAAASAGILFFPVLLMLVFRQKYPGWWWDWNLQLTRFEARVGSYFLLLRDEYPATDEEQAVHLDIDAPHAEELNRWLPLVKWFLAIPHYIVLFFLAIAVIVVTIIAWFAILFTGKHPRGMFGFVVGVARWGYRVNAYAFLLTTDRYPPFSLD